MKLPPVTTIGENLFFLWVKPISKHWWPLVSSSPQHFFKSPSTLCFDTVKFRLHFGLSPIVIALNKVFFAIQLCSGQFVLSQHKKVYIIVFINALFMAAKKNFQRSNYTNYLKYKYCKANKMHREKYIFPFTNLYIQVFR